MTRSYTSFFSLVVCLLAGQAWTLSSLSGSPCYHTCQGGNTTVAGDLVCTDKDFANTENGIVLTDCISCLANSTYSQGPVSDSMLFLGYVSMIQEACLTGNPSAPISSCDDDCTNVAGSLPTGFSKALFQNPWAFCSANNSAYLDNAPQCATCLQSQPGTVVLGNFVYVGAKGCQAQPDLSNAQPMNNAAQLFNTTVLDSNSKANTTTSPSSSATSPTKTAATTAASDTGKSSPTTLTTQNDNEKNTSSDGLSRGAAAAIGVIMGILGIIGIIALAVFARRRIQQNQGTAAEPGRWQRMPDSPGMVGEKGVDSAIPPAAGVYVPRPAPAATGLHKRTISLKSGASKSLKSLTPRTSQWYYAANPKSSGELSALPQRGWD